MPRWTMLVVAGLLFAAGRCSAQEPGTSQDLESWVGSRLDTDLGRPSGTSSELNTFFVTVDTQLASPRLQIADRPFSATLQRTEAVAGSGSLTGVGFGVPIQTFGTRPSYEFSGTVVPRATLNYRTDTGDEFVLVDYRHLEGAHNGTSFGLNEIRTGWRHPWSVGPVQWYTYVGLHGFSSAQNFVTPFMMADVTIPTANNTETTGPIPFSQGVAQSAYGGGPEVGTSLRWHWDAAGLTAYAALRVSALYVDESTNKLLRDSINGNYSYKSSQISEWGACSAALGLNWRPSYWPRLEVRAGYRFDYFGALSTTVDNLNGMQLIWHGPFAGLGYTF